MAEAADAGWHVARFQELAIVGIEDGFEGLGLRSHLCQLVVGVCFTLLGPRAPALLHQPQAHDVSAEAIGAARTPFVGKVVTQAQVIDDGLPDFGPHNGPGAGADPGKVRRRRRDCHYSRARIVTRGSDHGDGTPRLDAYLLRHGGQEISQVRTRRYDLGKDASGNAEPLQHALGPTTVAWVITLGRGGIAEFADRLSSQPEIEQVGDGEEGFGDV